MPNTVTMVPEIADPITCYSLYGRFRPLPLSCLLAQLENSHHLRFRFAVSSHCLVIFFKKFCSVSVCFLYNVLIVICHLISLMSTSVIVYVDDIMFCFQGRSTLANDRPRHNTGLTTTELPTTRVPRFCCFMA